MHYLNSEMNKNQSLQWIDQICKMEYFLSYGVSSEILTHSYQQIQTLITALSNSECSLDWTSHKYQDLCNYEYETMVQKFASLMQSMQQRQGAQLS